MEPIVAAGVSPRQKGFIKGKHHNRCKRLHPLLAASFEILHLERFVKANEIEDTDLDAIKKELQQVLEKGVLDINSISRELNELLVLYERYYSETLSGTLGATAKFWINYVNMIHLYHEFSRSIRTGDFDLYVYCLPKISSLFFLFNQPNYARWTVRYHDNLLRLKETHPQVEEEFRAGGFAVKRTKKSFSKTAIDLTLEQTVNANAASQKTRITSFTNSISARQRWAHSHSLSVTVLSHLMDRLGLNKKDDVSSDLKPAQIKKNCNDIISIKEVIVDTLNPFSYNDILDSSLLYNIASGKAASPLTTEFLLNMTLNSDVKRDNFINECFENPARFEERICREKLHTFAKEGAITMRKQSNKEVQFKMERNMFAKILHIALERKVDMGELLKYPLTPIPLSLCHLDGTVRSTKKSKFSKELKERMKSADPTHVDALIVDGFFFLHLICEVPSTFGRLSTLVFIQLCRLKAPRIDLVFDRMFAPSMKDSERQKRAGGNDIRSTFKITGPLMTVPSNLVRCEIRVLRSL